MTTHETTEERLTLTAQEAGRVLGVSANTVYRYALQNKLPHFRLGDRLLIPRRELESWIAEQARASVAYPNYHPEY
jgi:excisionase family DNA binding protein